MTMILSIEVTNLVIRMACHDIAITMRQVIRKREFGIASSYPTDPSNNRG